MDNKTFNNKKWNENRTHRRDGTADLMDQHFTRTEEELKSSETLKLRALPRLNLTKKDIRQDIFF